jgi:hypothetical protein
LSDSYPWLYHALVYQSFWRDYSSAYTAAPVTTLLPIRRRFRQVASSCYCPARVWSHRWASAAEKGIPLEKRPAGVLGFLLPAGMARAGITCLQWVCQSPLALRPAATQSRFTNTSQLLCSSERERLG